MTGIPVAPGELVDVGYLNEVARAHYRKLTLKQVVNTVAETDLLNGEITVGAGAMSTNRQLRLKAFGSLTQNSGGAQVFPRLKLKLGATTLIDTGTASASWATQTWTGAWSLEALITNAGAANSQVASLNLMAALAVGGATAGLPTTGFGIYGATGDDLLKAVMGNTAAVDTTVAQALALTVILPAASANISWNLYFATAEIL